MRHLLKQAVNLNLIGSVTSENKINNLIFTRVTELLGGGKQTDDEILNLYNRGLYDLIEYKTSHAVPCISGLVLRRHIDGALLNVTDLLADKYHLSGGDTFSVAHKNGAVPYGAVRYGNLLEEGGMLDLFHEIVHSWQSVAWPKQMHTISMIMTSAERVLSYTEKTVKDYELDRLNKGLASCCNGLSILSHHDYSLDVSTKNECCASVVLNIGGETFLFSDDENTLSRAISWHIRKERHAWLVAIHLLKKIANSFIDLEPGLSEDKMRGYAQNHLQSCVDGLNNVLRHDWRNA